MIEKMRQAKVMYVKKARKIERQTIGEIVLLIKKDREKIIKNHRISV